MEVDPVSSKIFIVVFGIIAFTIMILNLLIIIAILKDPLKKLRSVFSFLLVHLCICNCLTGAFPLPIYMYFLSVSRPQSVLISYAKSATHSIYTASVISTFALSIDRYKAIRDPIYHRHSSSIKRVGFYVLGIWPCVAVEFVGRLFLGPTFKLAFQIVTFTLMVAAGPIMYFRIRSVFKYHNHQEGDKNIDETLLLSSPEMIEQRRNKEKAVLNTCKVLIGLQIISWLPILILDYGETVIKSLSHKQVVLAGCIVNILGSIGAIGEPLVCILRLNNFKESIKYSFVRRKKIVKSGQT